MDKISFVKSGNKELAIHGDYLRFKDDDSIKDIVVDKITSISIEGINNQYSKLLWAILGFLSSIISWYFLEESLLSTLVSILSLIGGLIFFISYFVFSFYSKITIKTSRIDIVLEFSELKKNKILEFKKTLLSKISN
tara:strand:+ start:610 stop:1020 length:411 start_codon:yes stop_codon:yes gene_type:complete